MENKTGFDVHIYNEDNLVIDICILIDDELCLTSSKIVTILCPPPAFPHAIERSDAKNERSLGALV